MFGALAVGFWAFYEAVLAPDTDRARQEVQRFYDVRAPGSVRVDRCELLRGDSESVNYRCEISVECEKQVVFAVPRAAEPAPYDEEPLPQSRDALRLACPVRR